MATTLWIWKEQSAVLVSLDISFKTQMWGIKNLIAPSYNWRNKRVICFLSDFVLQPNAVLWIYNKAAGYEFTILIIDSVETMEPYKFSFYIQKEQ